MYMRNIYMKFSISEKKKLIKSMKGVFGWGIEFEGVDLRGKYVES